LLRKSKNYKIQDTFSITPDKLLDLFQIFTSQQEYYHSVGGFHSAALCDQNNIRISIEDVGRHNCLDKLSGLFLLGNKSFSPKIILLTGRISSEMFYKANKIQAPIIVTKTTPTHNSVIQAIKSNITVVGYMRSDSFTIFSHPERIQV
jgi:FdhD protein